MSIFTKEELGVLVKNNQLNDLGDLKPLTDEELIRVKTGEGVHLGLLSRAKAIIAMTAPMSPRNYVTRPELELMLEEHRNLAAKTMLIFMALERRGLISDNEILQIADDLKNGTYKGASNGAGKDETGTGKRVARKRPKAVAAKEAVYGPVPAHLRKRGNAGLHLRSKKGGKPNNS